MYKKGVLNFLFYLLSVSLFFSCGKGLNSNYKAKPRALGKMNEIVVVTDDVIWESPVQDTLDYYFGGPFPIIPRPEPIFDLRHFNTQEIMNESLRRQLRTYLIVADLSDTSSVTTKMVRKDFGEQRYSEMLNKKTAVTSIGKDKWANGQILVYYLANSKENLLNGIPIQFDAITSRIHDHDKPQLRANTYSKGENKGLTRKLLENYGVNLPVPLDFVVAKEDATDKILWLRKELRDGTMSIVFRKLKYNNPDQLDISYAKRLRDVYGKKYVSSTAPGSYMVTNDVDLPMFEYTIEIDGHYAKEYRGIWEMENDFMGGPFVCYTIIDPERAELLFIDTFVFMPGKSKRNYVQQLDLMVKELSW